MKTTSIFRGAATALVTPLTASGVDYEAFGRLIDWQIESGINALVIAHNILGCLFFIIFAKDWPGICRVFLLFMH